jgi:hypothetical protein
MRSQRTRDMITSPDVPRLANGGVALCHLCQRAVFFANGFLSYLQRALEHKARYPHANPAWSRYSIIEQ